MYHLVQYTTIQYLSQLFLNKAILQLPKCTFIVSALKQTTYRTTQGHLHIFNSTFHRGCVKNGNWSIPQSKWVSIGVKFSKIHLD